jgi:dynein heavy chain
MRKTNMTPKIMKLAKWQNLLEKLIEISETLDHIEHQLEGFLEQKRMSFPRFYFLSNDELLEILAKQSKLEEVEPRIGKCFEGLVKLYMKDKTPATSVIVFGMVSPEGEVVPFSKAVQAKGNIETWLDVLQKEMMDTIRKLIRQGYLDYVNEVQKSRQEWIREHRGQVVATVSQILWCLNTEDAINQSRDNANALYDWYDLSVAQLQQLTGMVRGELQPIERRIIVALITTDVHNRDITERLANNEVETVLDFLW